MSESRHVAAGSGFLLFLVASILWITIGLAHGVLLHQAMASEGGQHGMGQLVAWQTLVWGSWALVSPLIWMMATRWPLGADRRPGAVLANLAGGAFFLFVHLAMTTWFTRVVAPMAWSRNESFAEGFVSNLRSRMIFEGIIVIGVIAAANWMREADAARTRALMTARLEADLAKAELRALQLQIQPHFLFNSLHSIAGLVRDGRRDEAVGTIAALSDLLRYVLENGQRPEVSLEEELDFIERYLDVQKARFGEKLDIDIRIDPAVRRASVPNLVLQPLVENAISHGVARLPRGGTVSVGAARLDGTLRLTVRNDGPPIDRTETHRSSIGLANTTARLEIRYGDSGSLSIENVEGGVLATICIPFVERLE